MIRGGVKKEENKSKKNLNMCDLNLMSQILNRDDSHTELINVRRSGTH